MIRRESCPVCRSDDFRTLYSCRFADEPMVSLVKKPARQPHHLDQESYELRACARCRLAWQVIAMDDEEADRWYAYPTTVIGTERPDVRLPFFTSAAREVAMLVEALGGKPSELRFLDYGMGRGEWARIAGAFGVDSYGTEVSEALRANAARFGVTALAPDKLDGTFHLINTEQVIEHLADPRGMVEQLRDRLAPGGMLKISVPDATDLEKRLGRNEWLGPNGSRPMKVVAPLEHVNAFRRSTLIHLGKELGMVEATIPVRAHYVAAGDIRPGRPLLKALVRPFYRNVLRRGTYVFLRRA